MSSPHFGNYRGGINKKLIGLTAKHQERIGKYTKSVLEKCDDPYGLLSDEDFVELLSSMINADY